MHSQISLRRRDERRELALVLGLDILNREHGGGLLVDDGAEAGFALQVESGAGDTGRREGGRTLTMT